MSVIDKLIALKAITDDNTGEVIYDGVPEYDDHLYKEKGIRVVARLDRDDDPVYDWGYSGSYRDAVVVEFLGTFFKSNQFSGSYGRNEWTEWKEVIPEQITRYYYDKSTY